MIAKLNCDYARYAGARPAGVPVDLASLALPPRQSPDFAVVASPILRWNREVWMGTTASEGQEKQHFGKEVRRQVKEAVKKIMREHRCCKQIERKRKDVSGALAWSYAKLGWTLTGPDQGVDDIRNFIELDF